MPVSFPSIDGSSKVFSKRNCSALPSVPRRFGGNHLPARSVILPTNFERPREKKKLIEASAAHQIFGRAGRTSIRYAGIRLRPAHEDDVKYLRWKVKYDSIPEDTKDPGYCVLRNNSKRKCRNAVLAKPIGRRHSSKPFATPLPLDWPVVVLFLGDCSPIYCCVRRRWSRSGLLVAKRLMERGEIEAAQRELNQMLITLWAADYLQLDPKPQPLASKPADETISSRSDRYKRSPMVCSLPWPANIALHRTRVRRSPRRTDLCRKKFPGRRGEPCRRREPRIDSSAKLGR